MSEAGQFLHRTHPPQLTKKHYADAGLDICASVSCIIRARSSELIPTGLKLHVPEGHVGLIWPRSGLSVNYNIETGAGCIDSGYHGEIKVKLYNHGDIDYVISVGDRIAQLLTLPVNLQPYTAVSSFEKSSRGEAGFGSTGV